MPRTADKWDQRIDRARELGTAYPFATQILSFYSKLTALQKSSYIHFQSTSGNGRSTSLPPALDAVDLELLMARRGAFFSLIGRDAPGSLAEFARGLDARGPAACSILLRDFWPGSAAARIQSGERQPIPEDPAAGPPERHFERFCAYALLQPYAEFLADHADLPEPAVRRPFCPYCGSPPVSGVLRQEGDGGKRSLVCSFCRWEWDYLRIACPACDERDEKKLCLYSTPAFECVRVEACDTCRAYIKTVDLTKSGRAVPEVDELAAIPLSLWADEKGYRKVARNVIGL